MALLKLLEVHMDTMKNLLELGGVEYEALMEAYIERETLAIGEMPISDFFQLLLETEAARQGETIEVEGEVVAEGDKRTNQRGFD